MGCQIKFDLDTNGNIKTIEVKDDKESAIFVLSRFKEHIEEIQAKLKKGKE